MPHRAAAAVSTEHGASALSVSKDLSARHGGSSRHRLELDRQRPLPGEIFLDLSGQVIDPASTPVSGSHIRSAHFSLKAAFRLLRSSASISGRSSSRIMALIPATPREITEPTARPTAIEITLEALLVASSVISRLLVRRTTGEMSASDLQALALPEVVRIRATRTP
ncbi:hypothetical protein ACE0DR_02755 [Azotobacter sp. CWF10]